MNARKWALDAVTALAAAAVFGAGLVMEGRPPVVPLVLFTAILFAAENTQILLPNATTVSPGFMLIMASIAAFGGRGEVAGAAMVAAVGAVAIGRLRAHRFRRQLFHSSQYALAGAAAAAVFDVVGATSGPELLGAALAATLAFAVVNVGLVLPHVAMGEEVSPRKVWSDMKPAIPSYLAFGLLGLLLGHLFVALGWLALVLMVVPVVVGRKTFGAYLELKAAHEATVRVFVQAIEAKDPYTAGHTERVATYAQYVGEELGFSPARLEHLRYAALMHDIGKLAVPRRLLNKPGRLTADEYRRVQRHNRVCVDILTRVDFMRTMVTAASDEHAHYSDTGGRPVDHRVIEAHVVAVADAFDAMTSTRSYRRALAQDVAFAELRDKAGTQFNPEVVEALIAVIERRGEHYGLGHEQEVAAFSVPPPETGVGSAGLGDLVEAEAGGE